MTASAPILREITDRDGSGWPASIDIDTSVAHVARVWDFLSGGHAHFAADRDAVAVAAEHVPGGIEAMRAGVAAGRAFRARAVRFLAAEAGLRQFLVAGIGIPNGDSVHGAACRAVPQARVVYVDADPLVLAHAHELNANGTGAETAYVHSDLARPEKVLFETAGLLDLDLPVGILLTPGLHLVPDDHDPHMVVGQLIAALAPGSHLVLSHLASDVHPQVVDAVRLLDQASHETINALSRPDLSRFFDGLDLLNPGVVHVARWHPDAAVSADRLGGAGWPFYAGIGIKPTPPTGRRPPDEQR